MKKILLLLVAAWVAGCAGLTPVTPSGQPGAASSWKSRIEELYRITHWTIHGHLAVQAGNEGWSATLHWNQDDKDYALRLIAPLGQGTYQLRGADGEVTLLTADNRLYTASNAESLLQENLGWNVPLHGLKYWVMGVPEPGIATDSLQYDQQGRMIDLQQSGWRISISRYSEFDGRQLPSKLIMRNERFQLRLVVLEWKSAL